MLFLFTLGAKLLCLRLYINLCCNVMVWVWVINCDVGVELVELGGTFGGEVLTMEDRGVS